jgi:subfamily B ATP-binding cassette protein MsbA
MGLLYCLSDISLNILTPAKPSLKPVFRKNGLAAADRVFEVLEVENEITSKENAL